MDALSDVLKSVRLEGAVYINAEFTAPWCIESKFGLASIRARLAPTDHVVFFHFLTEGHCKVRVADSTEALEVSAGDLVVFAQGDAHLMGSDLQLAPVESASLMDPNAAADGDFIQMRHGGGGAATRFVCGYIACSRSVCRPLLEALPRVLVSRSATAPAAMLRELLRVGVRIRRRARRRIHARQASGFSVEAMPPCRKPARRKGWLRACATHNGRAWRPARRTGQGVDGRWLGAQVALSAQRRRAIRGAGRRAANAVPDALAPGARGVSAALGRGRRRARGREQRLRVGSRFQPRVQARIRDAARGLAPAEDT
jgi:hypothetical protein